MDVPGGDSRVCHHHTFPPAPYAPPPVDAHVCHRHIAPPAPPPVEIYQWWLTLWPGEPLPTRQPITARHSDTPPTQPRHAHTTKFILPQQLYSIVFLAARDNLFMCDGTKL